MTDAAEIKNSLYNPTTPAVWFLPLSTTLNLKFGRNRFFSGRNRTLLYICK